VTTSSILLVHTAEVVYVFGLVTDADGAVGFGSRFFPVLPAENQTGLGTSSGSQIPPVWIWGGGGITFGLAVGVAVVSIRIRSTQTTAEALELARALGENSRRNRPLK
jgi:hypothetical protein